MLDLDYSDSDASDSEQSRPTAPPRAQQPTAPPPKPSGLSSLLPKPKSRKHKDAAAVDPSAPKKIVVTLPKFDTEEGGEDDGRPAKKPRTGGMSGLSAMLPAPKRTAATAATVKRELGSGAAPPPPKAVDEEALDFEPRYSKPFEADKKTPEEEKKATSKGNTAFVPQSVARRQIQPMSAFRKKAPAAAAKVGAAKPMVSLFGSVSTIPSNPRPKATLVGEYKPIMLEAAKPMRKPVEETQYLEEDPGWGNTADAHQGIFEAQPQDLDALARQAGLDKNEMRQLYGRNGPGKEPIKFSTFSVDDEYNQNEIEREEGLAQEVKPVRTVAPGRHQLQSLLNVAQSQRGALEDSFARGKSTRKEASSRYGW